MSDLRHKNCVPCEGKTKPLTREEVMRLLNELDSWMVHENMKQIEKMFLFEDFAQSLAFANRIGELAENEGHHPDLVVSWGKLVVKLSTHAIRGLSENDFIVAAKIDELAGK